MSSLCVAFLVSMLLSGCSGSATRQDAAWAEAGRQYLLAEEPPDAQQLMQLREVLEQSGQLENVTLVGRVDGLSRPTWDPDRAAFMVADLSLDQGSS